MTHFGPEPIQHDLDAVDYLTSESRYKHFLWMFEYASVSGENVVVTLPWFYYYGTYILSEQIILLSKEVRLSYHFGHKLQIEG